MGRSTERGHLMAQIADASAGVSSAIVIRGVPGIGKTALLDELEASAPDLQRLRVAGIESELELPYAALHALLRPHLDRIGGLPAPQQTALGVAFGLLSAPAPSLFLVGLGALTLLADVARDAPLLCLVDDAQWLDQPSAAVLAFVARRLLGEGIVVVFCVREPVIGTDYLAGLPELSLGGLEEAEALALLVETAGRVDRRVATRLLAASEGNPLALIEFATELSSAQLSGGALIDDPLSLSTRLETHFARRVRTLPEATQTVLLVASACTSGESWRLWQAAGALGIRTEEVLESQLAEFLSLHEPMAFRHPLIRSAVYGAATPSQRRQAHHALAQVTDRIHDAERWAGHLAAATIQPDEAVAVEVEKAAARAHARGGFSAEATLLARASRLTPDPARAAGRSLAAAEAALLGGDAPGALRLVGGAEAALSTPRLRADSLRIRAGALSLVGRLGEAPLAYATAARALEPLDPRAAREAWLGALAASLFTEDRATGITAHQIAAASLVAPTPPGGVATVDDRLLEAFSTRIASGYVAALPGLRDVVIEMATSDHEGDTLPGQTMLARLATQELWDTQWASILLRRLASHQRSEGALLALHFAEIGLKRFELWAGRTDSAAAHDAAAEEIAAAIGGQTLPDITVVEADALRGDEAAVEAGVELLGVVADLAGIGQVVSASRLASAVLYLGRGRYTEAFGPAQGLYDDDPIGYGSQVLPELVEAAARSGEAKAAEAALARLAERAEASGTSWALGLLARSRGVASAGEEADIHFRLAVELLARAGLPFDLGRANLLYGEWLRRERRQAEARENLQAAYEVFVAMGAAGFAERTEAELRAAGVRALIRTRGGSNDLTPQEAHIARLAARGATNREIAAEVFLSQATVAYHLTKAYRKLQVTSRRQLARALPRLEPDVR